MRPIDADVLHDSLKQQPKWIVKRDGFINEGYSYDQVHFTIDKIPTVEVEPTYEQVIEYCRRRCLVIITTELFNDMRAIWGLLRKADDFEEPEINPCSGKEII